MWWTIDFMDACYCWSNQQPAASNIRNDENPTCSATATCAASSRDAASNCNSSNRKSNRYTWPCHECSHYADECSPKPLFQWAVYIWAVLLWAWFMVFFLLGVLLKVGLAQNRNWPVWPANWDGVPECLSCYRYRFSPSIPVKVI